MSQRGWVWLSLIGGALTILLNVPPGPIFAASPNQSRALGSPSGSSVLPSNIYTYTTLLPLVSSNASPQEAPIWTHTSEPAPHEVSLFRYTFAPNTAWENPELHIFADTRYEVWVDGTWVGRGPARFSSSYHEYDVYRLGTLPAASHVIAVLVQWAPNDRRSESSTPYLQARIQGETPMGLQMMSTGTRWKGIRTNAWRSDAALVHSWGLIGPTELLDLRRLPLDWTRVTFSDAAWPAAIPKQVSGVVYQPRSIPVLANVPITPTVVDAGLLSPGRVLGELVPPIADPYSLSFSSAKNVALTVETLGGPTPPSPDAMRLDGAVLSWKKAPTQRPDVYTALANIGPGPHVLRFAGVSSQGITFSISNQDIAAGSIPFQQGVHAGRRLLLAEPVTQLDKVAISSSPSMDIVFGNPPAYVVLDLGRTVHGRLRAQVAGPSGNVLDIGWDERLLSGTHRPLPYPGSLHPDWNQTDSWILDGNTRSITTLDARAGRFVLIAAWGSGAVQVRNIEVIEERFPVTPRGEFQSSDPLLNRIWQVGVDTLYPNMTDAYTDTPWRERGQWWGDAYVADHANQVAFGDTALLRRGLFLMSRAFVNGRPPGLAPNGDGVHMLDYGMLWVHSLDDYVRVSNDVSFASGSYLTLRQFMDYLATYQNPTTGLLDLPLGDWSQTVYIDPLAYNSRFGQATAVNAMYYGTLQRAADIADRLGDSASAARWRQEGDYIRQQVNISLYLPAQHRYATSIFQGVRRPPSPHAQAWALAYGLVPEAQVEPVMESLLELLSSDPSAPNVETYGMFWVLESLGKTGHIAEGLNLIKSYYGRMLNRGATTWWEVFNAHLYYSSTLSHAWSGAPTWFLTTYVLGARQLDSNSWQVKPAANGVGHVSGSLPLKNGSLAIDWAHPSCQDASLNLVAPWDSNGEIVVPFTGPSVTLTLNNTLIWSDGRALIDGVVGETDGIHVDLHGGTFVLSMHQECSNTFLPAVIR